MGLQQINTAVLAASLQGVSARGHKVLDALEINFLMSFVSKLRRQGENVWAVISSQERRYLHEVLLVAFRRGIIDSENIVAQELGLTGSTRQGERHLVLTREKDGAGTAGTAVAEPRQSIDWKSLRAQPEAPPSTPGYLQAAHSSSLGQSFARPPAESPAGTANDSQVEDRLPLPAQVVLHLRRHQLAILAGNMFEAQKSWRKFERAAEGMPERALAYLRALAVNEAMRDVPEHLDDLEMIVGDMSKTDDQRLRDFLHHAKALRKLVEQQARLLDDALERMPDPDSIISTTRRRALG